MINTRCPLIQLSFLACERLLMGKYIFIVDTEKYAGDFERQLTAYCTGQVGDCGVGEREGQNF